jgi:putative transposase
MERTRYAHYLINYHFAWCPKYRKKVLVGAVKNRLEEVLYELAERMDFNILSLEIMPDHVHLSVSTLPRYSPAGLVNAIKGVSSRKLRQDFPELRKHALWTRTYYVRTAGEVSTETVRRYIQQCQK